MSADLWYLASPYSHPRKAVRVSRQIQAAEAVAELKARGLLAISPIVHGAAVCQVSDLPEGWEEWREFDEALLACCHGVLVLCLPGWHMSVGVRAEIQAAHDLRKPVYFISSESYARCDEAALAVLSYSQQAQS